MKKLTVENVIKALETIGRKQRATIVDEIGRLDRKYRAWKPELDRLKNLKEEAARWAAADKLPADEIVTYTGRTYVLEYSPQALDREITDMGGVMNTLTEPEFLKRCTFALGTLDVLLPNAAELGLLKETPNAGPRRLVAIRRRERKLKVAA